MAAAACGIARLGAIEDSHVAVAIGVQASRKNIGKGGAVRQTEA
jgi:hypothetical protein